MRIGDALEPNNLRLVFAGLDAVRDVVRDLRDDLSFARAAARALGPGRHRHRPHLVGGLPPRAPWPAPLTGVRVGVVASGGSGATASLVGIQRAFEEAGARPVAISACSGSALFGSLWAAGLSADEVARFWLGLDTGDYVDPDWGHLVRAAAFRRMRGWSGLLKGDALERAIDERTGGMRLGDTPIPFHVVAWNIDKNRVEDLSSRTRPELTVARAARIAISIPIFVAPVQMDGAWYGDGGIVDIFPTGPFVAEHGGHAADRVIGANCYLPPGFAGEDIGDWYDETWSILRASGQLRYSVYGELAREHARRLGDRLVLLDPVPYDLVRGARFYETFLDRAAWPHFMALGHDAARAALERIARERPAQPAAAAPAPAPAPRPVTAPT